MTAPNTAHVGEKLLPCPFDGEPARLIEGHKDHWRAQCSRCGANIGDFYTREDGKRKAIAAWNRRALSATPDVGEKLRLAVEALERIKAGREKPVEDGSTVVVDLDGAEIEALIDKALAALKAPAAPVGSSDA